MQKRLAVVNKFNLHSQQFHPTLIKSNFKDIMHKITYGFDCEIEGWYFYLGLNENRNEIKYPKLGISINSELNISSNVADDVTSQIIEKKNPNGIHKGLEGLLIC